MTDSARSIVRSVDAQKLWDALTTPWGISYYESALRGAFQECETLERALELRAPGRRKGQHIALYHRLKQFEMLVAQIRKATDEVEMQEDDDAAEDAGFRAGAEAVAKQVKGKIADAMTGSGDLRTIARFSVRLAFARSVDTALAEVLEEQEGEE